MLQPSSPPTRVWPPADVADRLQGAPSPAPSSGSGPTATPQLAPAAGKTAFRRMRTVGRLARSHFRRACGSAVPVCCFARRPAVGAGDAGRRSREAPEAGSAGCPESGRCAGGDRRHEQAPLSPGGLGVRPKRPRLGCPRPKAEGSTGVQKGRGWGQRRAPRPGNLKPGVPEFPPLRDFGPVTPPLWVSVSLLLNGRHIGPSLL